MVIILLSGAPHFPESAKKNEEELENTIADVVKGLF